MPMTIEELSDYRLAFWLRLASPRGGSRKFCQNITISITIKYTPLPYRRGCNQKRSIQSMNMDHKSLDTVFSIVICRQSGDKRQWKTLFLTILDQRLLIVLTCSIAAYLMCLLNILKSEPKQSETRATRNNLQLKKIVLFPHRIDGNQKRYELRKGRSEIASMSVLDCHLSPVGRPMAIKNSVSNYFWSTLVDSIDVFYCRLYSVVLLYSS